ncbi:epidermis-specific secreted glycoprotein EP1-like [Pyrus ussuriensis x Pyrus communis]|uniref:Epidermis-specific secreted glycoprotein EP1-like n=1 Tax=Pyrus ussuriensis x Pyrus communis TaxID=2448454 RepID=A0A5N5FQZ2_9ROSA|nr:epidermis-specific secreted glycoprotein EP1-like [Pyrus ussuriensis x Pyrus communis]
MGLRRSESGFYWVWEANRGKPVGQNATFAFGTDGNLVLADADGQVAWQSNTANKGVGNFVWQSFHHPSDTLLVGQSLRAGGVSKLVSRASEVENKDGSYSLVMEPKGLSLYYKSKNSPRPLLYFTSSKWINVQKGSLNHVTLKASPDTQEGFAYDLSLDYVEGNSTTGGNVLLARPKYNSTSTFLRLEINGNLRLHTYYRILRYGAWEKLTSCDPKSFHYYKVEGVDHFLSKYTKGDSIKESDCAKKCTLDCKCLGYFYNQDTSKCWIAYDLKTLTKVANSTHVGYIKAPNH